MTLDVSSVSISKMASIFKPKYKNGHKMYIFFTLWPYSIVMHGFSAVYEIVALGKNSQCQKMKLISSKLFILWRFPDFEVKLTAILEKSTELTSRVISKYYFLHFWIQHKIVQNTTWVHPVSHEKSPYLPTPIYSLVPLLQGTTVRTHIFELGICQWCQRLTEYTRCAMCHTICHHCLYDLKKKPAWTRSILYTPRAIRTLKYYSFASRLPKVYHPISRFFHPEFFTFPIKVTDF